MYINIFSCVYIHLNGVHNESQRLRGYIVCKYIHTYINIHMHIHILIRMYAYEGSPQ